MKTISEIIKIVCIVVIILCLCSCGSSLSANTENAQSDQIKTDSSSQKDNAFSGKIFLNENLSEGYQYSYNDNGLCILAESEDEKLEFHYEYDSDNRPHYRYIHTDENEYLFEEYDYYDSGELHFLTVYDEDGNVGQFWEYDRRGRAISGYMPVQEPDLPGFYSSEVEYIIWNDNNQLLSLSLPIYSFNLNSYDDLLRFFVSSEATEEQREAAEKEISDYIVRNDDILTHNDNGYLLQDITEEYEYDKLGRLIRYTHSDEWSPLYCFLINHDQTEKYNQTNKYIFTFDYSEDSYVMNTSTYVYHDGELINDPAELAKTLTYDIEYDTSGLPIKIREKQFDFYDKFDCTVTGATVGVFGVRWCDTYYDLYGELHGSFWGIDPDDLSILGLNNLQSVLVNGIGNNGEKVEYLLWPDRLGRQACLKTFDGILVMDRGTQMDPTRQNEYGFDQDMINRKYEFKD